MIRMISGLGLSMWLIGGSTALAKSHDPHGELKLEHFVAIHAPTGCASLVEYDDGTFVQAFITDPLCLPSGVSKRFIPSSKQDFLKSDPVQTAITNP